MYKMYHVFYFCIVLYMVLLVQTAASLLTLLSLCVCIGLFDSLLDMRFNTVLPNDFIPAM